MITQGQRTLSTACGLCSGTGTQTYRPYRWSDETRTRTCPRCWGTGALTSDV